MDNAFRGFSSASWAYVAFEATLSLGSMTALLFMGQIMPVVWGLAAALIMFVVLGYAPQILRAADEAAEQLDDSPFDDYYPFLDAAIPLIMLAILAAFPALVGAYAVYFGLPELTNSWPGFLARFGVIRWRHNPGCPYRPARMTNGKICAGGLAPP